MDKSYPEVDQIFSGTEQLLVRATAQMIAAINKDYSYTDNVMDNTNLTNRLKQSGINPSDVALRFLLLSLQTASSVMDPTWRTPWFLPGPLHTIGVITKLLSTDWGESKKPSSSIGQQEEECSDEEA